MTLEAGLASEDPRCANNHLAQLSGWFFPQLNHEGTKKQGRDPASLEQAKSNGGPSPPWGPEADLFSPSRRPQHASKGVSGISNRRQQRQQSSRSLLQRLQSPSRRFQAHAFGCSKIREPLGFTTLCIRFLKQLSLVSQVQTDRINQLGRVSRASFLELFADRADCQRGVILDRPHTQLR